MLSPIHALWYVRFTEFTEFNESLLHQKIRQTATLWVKFSLNICQVISGFKEETGDTGRLPDVHVGTYKYTQRGDKDEPISGKSTWIGDYLWGLEIISLD